MTSRLVALAFALALFAPAGVRAQAAIWNPNFPQTWPPGAYSPDNYHDLPFSHRYGYYSGPALYFGMSGRQAYYLEYLDRVDRAERFGRPIPPPPAILLTPPCRPIIVRQGPAVQDAEVVPAPRKAKSAPRRPATPSEELAVPLPEPAKPARPAKRPASVDDADKEVELLPVPQSNEN